MIEQLARPEILAMKPYVSARSGAAADGVLLNANEAPETLLEDPAWQQLELNRYPSPQPPELCQRLARLYGVEPGQLLVTRGSDEGIDLLVRVFCRPGEDAVLECPPCFGMYRIAAQIQGAGIISVDRDPETLRLDIAAITEQIALKPGIRLVFLTSPNNPTGDLLSRADLLNLLAACAGRALLVLDEAYIEFCADRSAVELVSEHPNLVVLRTLSKAWAAAGLRCGSVIADPVVIELLSRVIAPYPLSAPVIKAALMVTEPAAATRQSAMLDDLALEKRRLLRFLDGLARVRETWPGEANFVLIRVDDGPGLVEFCTGLGVRLRDFSGHALLDNCVRLTIGNETDMRQLRAALNEWELKQ
jgi:histidinol-phosphate aminotransferase